MRVVWWLLGGTVLLISFTNELVGVSVPLASGLRHVRDSGPLGVNTVAFITSTAGRVLLLVVALACLRHADPDAIRLSSLPSVTVRGVRVGWHAVRRWITQTR
jgi:hypothetical protein